MAKEYYLLLPRKNNSDNLWGTDVDSFRFDTIVTVESAPTSM